MTRETSLVRAELVDAMRDYAEVFRQKAALELERAANVEKMADRIASGGHAEQPDIQLSQEWDRQQQLAHMRFQELQMRVNRLILEHGDN